MGKFKIGDRVKRVAGNNPGSSVGHVAVVKEFQDNGRWVTFEDGTAGWTYNFEVVQNEWRPKIGDRVRFIRDSTAGGSRFGAKGQAATVAGVIRENVEYGDAVDVKLDNSTVGFHPGAYLNDLEPLLAAVPLTIEAGKFYKTRDGRKVGPAKKGVPSFIDKAYGWTVGTDYYVSDGRFYEHAAQTESDLVAEWVDEPVANDNAAATEPPAKSTFKIGDRVTGCTVFEEEYTGTIVEVDEGDDWLGYRIQLGNSADRKWLKTLSVRAAIEPASPAIVCLIENGQPKPSTYPRVHADEAAASGEAARLASVYKGQKFGVFVLMQTVSEQKTYAHEWQRLAVAGEKISAIKSLRAANDLTLKGAKDAVEHWLDVNAA